MHDIHFRANALQESVRARLVHYAQEKIAIGLKHRTVLQSQEHVLTLSTDVACKIMMMIISLKPETSAKPKKPQPIIKHIQHSPSVDKKIR